MLAKIAGETFENIYRKFNLDLIWMWNVKEIPRIVKSIRHRQRSGAHCSQDRISSTLFIIQRIFSIKCQLWDNPEHCVSWELQYWQIQSFYRTFSDENLWRNWQERNKKDCYCIWLWNEIFDSNIFFSEAGGRSARPPLEDVEREDRGHVDWGLYTSLLLKDDEGKHNNKQTNK